MTETTRPPDGGQPERPETAALDRLHQDVVVLTGSWLQPSGAVLLNGSLTPADTGSDDRDDTIAQVHERCHGTPPWCFAHEPTGGNVVVLSRRYPFQSAVGSAPTCIKNMPLPPRHDRARVVGAPEFQAE